MLRRSFLKTVTLACGVCLLDNKIVLPDDKIEPGYHMIDPRLLVCKDSWRICKDYSKVLYNSIEEMGMVNPVLIDEGYVVIDGFYRVHVALDLKLQQIPVHVLKGRTFNYGNS